MKKVAAEKIRKITAKSKVKHVATAKILKPKQTLRKKIGKYVSDLNDENENQNGETRWNTLRTKIGTPQCLQALQQFLSKKPPQYNNPKLSYYDNFMNYINVKGKLNITKASLITLTALSDKTQDTRIPILQELMTWGQKEYGVVFIKEYVSKFRGALTPESSLTSIIKKGLEIEKSTLGLGEERFIYEFDKANPVGSPTPVPADEAAFLNQIARLNYENKISDEAHKYVIENIKELMKQASHSMKMGGASIGGAGPKVGEVKKAAMDSKIAELRQLEPYQTYVNITKAPCGWCWCCRTPIYIYYSGERQLNTCGQDEHVCPPGIGNILGVLASTMQITNFLLLHSAIASLGLLPSHAWCNQIKGDRNSIRLPTTDRPKYSLNMKSLTEWHEEVKERNERLYPFSYEILFRANNPELHALYDPQSGEHIKVLKTLLKRLNVQEPVPGVHNSITILTAAFVRLIYFGCSVLAAFYKRINAAVYAKFSGLLKIEGGARQKQRGGVDPIKYMKLHLLLNEDDMNEIVAQLDDETYDINFEIKSSLANPSEEMFLEMLEKIDESLNVIRSSGEKIKQMYERLVGDLDVSNVESEGVYPLELEKGPCNSSECDTVPPIIVVPPSIESYQHILEDIRQKLPDQDALPLVKSTPPPTLSRRSSVRVKQNLDQSNVFSLKSMPGPRRSARLARKRHQNVMRSKGPRRSARLALKPPVNYRIRGGRFSTRKHKKI